MSEGVTEHSVNIEPQTGLWQLLWNDLKPFPGRDLAALRMAIVCTAIVLLTNTFRLPFQDVLPFLALFTAKEEKITTAITAILALSAITVSIGAAILIFKLTGNRPEFRIPGMALEIFIGMYLFRVLSLGPVGFILAFIVSVAQSVVDLYPTPEGAVHEFLWLWVAVALGVSFGWLGTIMLFPVSAKGVLQRHFITGWHTISIAAKQLSADSTTASRCLLYPLAKLGPIRLLKALKLSLLETHGLRSKQKELTRLSLALDKVAKLLFSYTERSTFAVSSSEKVVLGRVVETAEYFEQEFSDGFVPCGVSTDHNERERARTSENGSAALQLVEAECTLEDLTVKNSEVGQPKEARVKKSLFVADAFTNPKHVQFALKVTLAGMIGYIFYTASDYFGIHTVYYTPLIIALGSTGATMYKGVLRIAGCVIGGALGLICTIWVIPRFDTLGMYLLIVFCVHGLAAWVAFGSERISYMGLQIALAFDLGVLQDYAPPPQIDPIRDRFIGIVLGIVIISSVFSLVWPEDARTIARQKLAASLQAIARLLNIRGGSESNPQRERLELEIASHLAEANASQEQVAFEGLIHGLPTRRALDLETTTTAVEEVYVACLPWIRQETVAVADRGTANREADMFTLVGAVEASAAIVADPSGASISQDELMVGDFLQERDSVSVAGDSSESFKELIAAVKGLQVVVWTPSRA